MHIKSVLSLVKILGVFLFTLLLTFIIPACFLDIKVALRDIIYFGALLLSTAITIQFSNKKLNINILNYISIKNIKYDVILAFFILGFSSVAITVNVTSFLWVRLFNSVELPESSLMGYFGYSIFHLICDITIVPLVEEIIFRICCIESIRKQDGTFVAVILSSIAFGIFHLGGICNICEKILGGLILSIAYIVTRNAVYSIATHMAMNTFVVVLWFLSNENITVTWRLNGYTLFTLPVFLASVILFLLSLLFLIYKHNRLNTFAYNNGDYG